MMSFRIRKSFPPQTWPQQVRAGRNRDLLRESDQRAVGLPDARGAALVSTEDDLHHRQAVPQADDTALPAGHACNMPLRLKFASLR